MLILALQPHRIDVGEFTAFNTYMVLLTFPIIAVGWVVNLFQRGTASIKRIDEILRSEPEIDDRRADTSLPADLVLRGEIEFRGLNFSYGDKPVLEDIRLHVPAGSTLAIIGPTGRSWRKTCSTRPGPSWPPSAWRRWARRACPPSRKA